MRIEHQPSKLRVAGSSPAGRARPRPTVVSMVDVAQLVEPRIVDPVVVGSSPIVHPKYAGFSPGRFKLSDFFGPLAQLVEQLTLNQLVVGSSPTRPTIFNIRISSLFHVLFLQPLRVLLSPGFYFEGEGCPVYSSSVAVPPHWVFLGFFPVNRV